MSAQKKPILTLTRKASATLLKYQVITALGAVAALGAAGFGVVTEDAASGDAIAVDVLGTTVVVASTTIADGAKVQVAADGKVVTATTGVPIGIALQPAVANEPFEILLTPGLSAPPEA